MPVCKGCGDEVDELEVVRVEGKSLKRCESCAEELRTGEAIAEQSESAVQSMMGFQGRR